MVATARKIDSVPGTLIAAIFAQIVDRAPKQPDSWTVKVMTSARVSIGAKMSSFQAKMKVNTALAEMPWRATGRTAAQRLKARAAIDPGALLELDRHVLEAAGHHRDPVGQIDCEVERLGGSGRAEDCDADRDRSTLANSGAADASITRNANGRSGLAAARAGLLVSGSGMSLAWRNQRHSPQAQAVGQVRSDQGGLE
jgi:hypothetical protein